MLALVPPISLDFDGAPATWGSAQAPAATQPPRTQAERALSLLRDDIVPGRIGPGVRLRPEGLDRKHGVGLTPVREALLRLTAQGLVVVEGQRGFEVPGASGAELLDIARVRSELPRLALRDSITLGDDPCGAAVVPAFHRLRRIPPLMVARPVAHARWRASKLPCGRSRIHLSGNVPGVRQ